MTETYRLGHNAKGDAFIECLVCGRKSYHPKDIEHKYCGFCHQFHEFLSPLVEIAWRYGRPDPDDETFGQR